MTLRVGLVQLRTPANRDAALAHATPLIRKAAQEGAQFILTPEGTNILERDREKLLPQLKSADEDPAVIELRQLAEELNVWLAIGSALVIEQGKAANRQLLVSPQGKVVAGYDKIHMFDVDLPSGESVRESETYEPGSAAVVVDTPLAKFGLSVCYDIRFPGLYRTLAQAGAQVITVPSAFTRPTGQAHWEILLRARAIETGAFVLAAAQGGFHEDGRGTWGRSMVVGPWGEVIGKLDHDEPGVLLADLDLAAVAAARLAIPALKNTRDFSVP